MKATKYMILAQVFALAALIAASCDKFSDDLQGLGARVEKLEDSLSIAEKELNKLTHLAQEVEDNGYITEVLIDSVDSTLTLVFNDGDTIVVRQGKDGADGVDGKTTNDLGLTIRKYSDGYYYWWCNGDWLLDAYGNKMRASGINGQKGADGESNLTAIVPRIRINSDNKWEISTDGGITWQKTGVTAIGKDGKDGAPGASDQIFLTATIDEVKNVAIFYLLDGTTIVVPLYTED